MVLPISSTGTREDSLVLVRDARRLAAAARASAGSTVQSDLHTTQSLYIYEVLSKQNRKLQVLTKPIKLEKPLLHNIFRPTHG
jgi:hypothetical protein